MLTPVPVLAACTAGGETVVYVNGILTSEDVARNEKKALQDKFINLGGDPSVAFLVGYNPSHGGGAGDLIKSIEQIYQKPGSYVDDYDLKIILQTLQPQITTRRILLVGHSQGAFYTNAMYDYLVTHGVPRDAVAVYNVATPASFTEGSGSYLTSSNDKVINSVRDWAAKVNAPQPLVANIDLTLTAVESSDAYGGHSFQNDYLAQASGHIVTDMQNALGRLSNAGATLDGVPGFCFTVPPDDPLDAVTHIGYNVLDTSALAVGAPIKVASNGFSMVASAVVAFAKATYSTAVAFANFVSNPLATLPPANMNTPAKAFNVVKQTYGSSLTEQDVRELNSMPAKNNGAAVVLALAPAVPKVQTPPTPAVQTQVQPVVPITTGVAVAPGFGSSAPPPQQNDPPQLDVPLASATPLAILAPDEQSLFATTSVTFFGTTTPDQVIDINFGGAEASTTADASGNWSISLVLPEGSTPISFVIHGESSTSTRTVIVDTTPPSAPALSAAECAYSLSASSCLIATTTVTLSWVDDPDVAHYAIAVNGEWVATTTGTGAVLALPDQANTILEVAALDGAGNVATSSAQHVTVFVRPIVFNEVAWSGIPADSSAQWIGLRNRTSYDIDLSRMVALSATSSISLTLSGIAASSSAPMDAYSDSYVFGAPGMSVGGEELMLVHDMGALGLVPLDMTPPVSACAGWCAGAPGGFQMERIDPALNGALLTSWHTYAPLPPPPPPGGGPQI